MTFKHTRQVICQGSVVPSSREIGEQVKLEPSLGWMLDALGEYYRLLMQVQGFRLVVGGMLGALIPPALSV